MSSEDRKQWLAKLKPGDLVAVCPYRGIPRVGEVVNRTPTGMIDVRWQGSSCVERYSAKGMPRGARSHYHRDDLEPYDDRVREAVRRGHAIRSILYLRESELEGVSTDNIVKASELLGRTGRGHA